MKSTRCLTSRTKSLSSAQGEIILSPIVGALESLRVEARFTSNIQDEIQTTKYTSIYSTTDGPFARGSKVGNKLV